MATEEPGPARALSLVPQPDSSSPPPVSLACPRALRVCGVGPGPGTPSCWVLGSVAQADRDGVCPVTICQFPLCSQSVGKLTLP